MATDRKQLSIRLSPQAEADFERACTLLTERAGVRVSKTSVLERAMQALIRELTAEGEPKKKGK
jgi:hypothetical protein